MWQMFDCINVKSCLSDKSGGESLDQTSTKKHSFKWVLLALQFKLDVLFKLYFSLMSFSKMFLLQLQQRGKSRGRRQTRPSANTALTSSYHRAPFALFNKTLYWVTRCALRSRQCEGGVNLHIKQMSEAGDGMTDKAGWCVSGLLRWLNLRTFLANTGQNAALCPKIKIQMFASCLYISVTGRSHTGRQQTKHVKCVIRF